MSWAPEDNCGVCGHDADDCLCKARMTKLSPTLTALLEAKTEVSRLLEENERLRDALTEANVMVCKFYMPYGWPEFQRKHGLPGWREVREATPEPCKGEGEP